MLICPACAFENEPTASNCVSCGKDLLGLGPGSVVANKYEIISLLGKGGMGVVFKARDRHLDEVVALKVLRTDSVITPEVSKRFRAEIKMARQVTHKNVCRIHEYGEDGALQYISMAYMEGIDLKQVLRERGALPAAEAYEISIAVAEGLQAVHDQGIVHRDLKTPNIMKDKKGLVRLMDFGIAKQVEEGVHGLTATGMIVGTPEYMSPEQCRGTKVDSRSDIYALGIVVYELFTGRTPFRGDTAITTIIKHLQEPPPLSGPEAAGIPAAVIPVLAKALAKDADERFASSHDMAVALERARAAPVAETTEDEKKTTVLPAARDTADDPTRIGQKPVGQKQGGTTPAGPTVITATDGEGATEVRPVPKGDPPPPPQPPPKLDPKPEPKPEPKPPKPEPKPPKPKPEPPPPEPKPFLSPVVIGLIVLVVAGTGFGGYKYFSSTPSTTMATAPPSPTLPTATTLSADPAVRLRNPESPIRVGLVTEEGKATYQVGEKGTFLMTSDTPGYLYLIAFSANDEAHVIFPSAKVPNNQIRPGAPTRFAVPFGGPPSRDVIVALVSLSPLKLGDKQYTHEEVFQITTSQAGASSGSWQSASLLLETKAKE